MAIVSGSNTILNQFVPNFCLDDTSDGEVLVFDENKNAFVNSSAECETACDISLNDLLDVHITDPIISQYLRYDGLEWVNSYLSISDDTDPMLSNDLDLNGYRIITETGSGFNIELAPDAALILKSLKWPDSDGTSGQVLTTDGNGNLSFQDGKPAGNLMIMDFGSFSEPNAYLDAGSFV